ncbi:MAG: hypothetical protein AAGA91_16265 [Pseudomonadota bacterium]
MKAVRYLHGLVPLTCGLLACAPLPEPKTGSLDATPTLSARPWPEADRLFDPRVHGTAWRGADVANSIPIDHERTLWLFGDTLLSQPGANTCGRFDDFQVQVNNSLGMQRGLDPATASMSFFWGESAGKPDAFFAAEGGPDSWLWMGGGTRVNDSVIVFLMQARTPSEPSAGVGCGGLAFEMIGWQARIARIGEGDPDTWQWHPLRLPETSAWQSILAGSSSVWLDDGFLYAYSGGPSTPTGNPVYLARWSVADVRRRDLSSPQWYTLDGWRTQAELAGLLPHAVVTNGNAEIYAAPDPLADDGWLWVQSESVIDSPLCYRRGAGPFEFGRCEVFYRPPELTRYPDSDLLVYAVKLHPRLSGQDKEVAATYVVNSCQLQDIQQHCELYYPRFLKLYRRADE